MAEAGTMLGIAILFGAAFRWGFRALPRERWQMIAAVPTLKDPSGAWRGVNLTWYGFFSATANVAATAVALLLLGALGVGRGRALAAVAILLAAALPAARLIARWVERKRHTFTVSGAALVGFLLAPLLLPALSLPALPALAALGVAYAFGEGLGRLACVSFGCCYGKPLSACSPPVRRLFLNHAVVFHGPTKKACYAGGFEGEPLVPVQAASSLVLVALGWAGMGLFLLGAPGIAFLVTIAGSQVWRFLSERLRADHRGGGRLTGYQKISVLLSLLSLALALFLPRGPLASPSLGAGARLLWDPGVLLLLQALWIAVFVYTGRSTVTASTLSFHVRRENV
jgi:hypothetical protein